MTRHVKQSKRDDKITYSVLMELTTSCVNLDGSTCHAPQAPTPSAYSAIALLFESDRLFELEVEIGRRGKDRAAKKPRRERPEPEGRQKDVDRSANDERPLSRRLANSIEVNILMLRTRSKEKEDDERCRV